MDEHSGMAQSRSIGASAKELAALGAKHTEATSSSVGEAEEGAETTDEDRALVSSSLSLSTTLGLAGGARRTDEAGK